MKEVPTEKTNISIGGRYIYNYDERVGDGYEDKEYWTKRSGQVCEVTGIDCSHYDGHPYYIRFKDGLIGAAALEELTPIENLKESDVTMTELSKTMQNVEDELTAVSTNSVEECEKAIQIVKNHITLTLSKLFPYEVFEKVIQPNLYYTSIKSNDGRFIVHANNPEGWLHLGAKKGQICRGDLHFKYKELKPVLSIVFLSEKPSGSKGLENWLSNTAQALENALSLLETIENNIEHIYGEIKRQAEKKSDAKKATIESMKNSTSRLNALVGKVSEPKEPVGKTINIVINL